MLPSEELNIIREVVIQAELGDPEAQKIIDDIYKEGRKTESRSAGNTTTR